MGCKTAWRNVGLAIGAATAAAAAANALVARNRPELEPGVEGEHAAYDWDGGRVFYTRKGQGHPILLLHSHNAAASSYEVRQAFAELSRGYQVFAPDLPGYGLSERRDREYFAATYSRFILDFIRDVIGAPAIVIASSVTAAQAILAAHEDPEAVSHVVAVAPTGLTARKTTAPASARALAALISVPVWGQTAFNALTMREGIRGFLEERVYDNPWNVTVEMVDHAWHSARQENAIHAPKGFLNGDLWTDARAAYAGLRQPLLVLWGDKDRINPYAVNAPLLSLNTAARVGVITNAGAAPYDEQAQAFSRVVTEFLAEHDAPPHADAG